MLTTTSAQAIPAATSPIAYEGFQLPNVGGSLQYSLTASELILLGYNGQPNAGATQVSSISGNLAYLSKSKDQPFSAIYSGGYIFGNSTYPSSSFQDLLLSKTLRTRNWNFVAADAIAYLPQSPTTGLSGIPGIGDIGITPTQNTTTTGLGILTAYSTSVSNSATGTVSRNITGSTMAQGTVNYAIQRFVGSTVGLSDNQISGGGGVEHRINARSSDGVNYLYSATTFPGTQYFFTTQTLLGQYSRQFTRQLSINGSVGPQRVTTGDSSILSTASTNVAGSVVLLYVRQKDAYSLNYTRGVNNGAGVIVGSFSDSLNLTADRSLNRVWTVAAVLGYNRSSNIPSLNSPSFSSNGVVFSAQASRALTHTLSAYSSYTIQWQSVAGLTAVDNAFNGRTQVIGFGITYAPRPFLSR